MKQDKIKDFLEIQDENFIGKDPRKITKEQYENAGFQDKPLLKVIREKCLDCCCGDSTEVRKCPAVDCALWAYRMGSNPLRKRDLSDEQRAALAERLALSRKS